METPKTYSWNFGKFTNDDGEVVRYSQICEEMGYDLAEDGEMYESGMPALGWTKMANGWHLVFEANEGDNLAEVAASHLGQLQQDFLASL